MKNKFEFGIEISESVSKTSVPSAIKRYDTVKKENVKVKSCKKNVIYRYRPGVNTLMTGDLDV